MINTLYDLTGRRAGIVIHSGEPPFACDWSRIYGLPRCVYDTIHGLGEPLPNVRGHWYDRLDEFIAGVEFPGWPEPQRGWVYLINDVVIIVPDEWGPGPIGI